MQLSIKYVFGQIAMLFREVVKIILTEFMNLMKIKVNQVTTKGQRINKD